MSKRGIAAGSGLALAAVIMGEGNRVASDAFAAIEITLAVAVVLAVLGLVTALVIRANRPNLTYRPDPGITRARADVIGIVSTRPGEPRSAPRALADVPERPALLPAASDRRTSARR